MTVITYRFCNSLMSAVQHDEVCIKTPSWIIVSHDAEKHWCRLWNATDTVQRHQLTQLQLHIFIQQWRMVQHYIMVFTLSTAYIMNNSTPTTTTFQPVLISWPHSAIYSTVTNIVINLLGIDKHWQLLISMDSTNATPAIDRFARCSATDGFWFL